MLKLFFISLVALLLGIFFAAVADPKKIVGLSALHKGDVLKWDEIIPRVLNHQLPSQ